jgi:transcription-repair coupling factor (superfamily II helicase)
MQTVNPFLPPLPKKPAAKLRYGNLPGSALAFAISQVAKTSQAPMLVVTTDSLSANRLEETIRFFEPEQTILNFPDWETLPYDHFSPHQDIISQRLLTLSQLPTFTNGVLLVPVATLLQRLAPQNYVAGSTFSLQKGEKLALDTMRHKLEASGYRCVAQVMEHAEFAVRGSILDLFPSGSNVPYRIDLLDNEVDSIRTFDPETQRSIEAVEHIQLLPAREFPLTDQAITHFRQSWREKFPGDPTKCSLYQDVSQGFCPPGIEYYLPLFFEKTQLLLNYLPNNTTIIRVNDIQQAAEHFWQEVNQRYEQARYNVTRPLLAPIELYSPINDLFASLNTFSQIFMQAEALDEGAGKYNFSTKKLPDLAINHKAEKPLAALQTLLATQPARTLFCAETAGRREALLELFKTINLKPAVCTTWQEFLTSKSLVHIITVPLFEGFWLTEPATRLITETELFGQQTLQQRRRKAKSFDSEAIVRNLAELQVGAPVVHIDHGVGRYMGLQVLNTGDIQTEFLTLEYANGDKLYVPVSSLHLISRYSGIDLEHAPLHRLGSGQWEKAKRKASEQINDAAAELLDIYARRAARQGHSFAKPDAQYAAFAATFPFEETPDQQLAIEKVIQDMTSGKPMDRLICGDVGFGKTEVAMRAAFLAVQDGKQVAILVPTTLLAQQHYQNFTDRFADWPVQIDVLSRFRSAKEQKNILDKVQLGTLDILIGTHKLLQQDVKFKKLGLLIIDEEHRFGVQQKEKLKSLRADVDILTLTATPIPRTLNMAFSGLRELSIIATPPARRLAIKTFVRERSPALIREAVLRELLRGGQVYFLHNEVESIEKVAAELAALIPEARVSVAHGQMRERELERIMADFYHHRFNVLVCTTIIETGIDIPTANTIIMDRADKLGLAQLHQLRGRVGRSHHQAYAYLITPPQKSMTADASKRLDAIASLEDLGAGFTLATHDLEIRGAGELLGEGQSGNMQAIGFSLYMELLEHAVKALKSGKQPFLEKPLHHGLEIDLHITALIPENYLPDVHTRLIFYKRIAHVNSIEQIRELQVEMIDRFGLLPQAVQNLFKIAELKLKATSLGIRKIDTTNTGLRVEFDATPTIDPGIIIQLIQKQPHLYKLDGPNRLRFNFTLSNAEEIVQQAFLLLDKLSRH